MRHRPEPSSVAGAGAPLSIPDDEPHIYVGAPPPTAAEIGITDEDFEEFVRVIAEMHPGYGPL